MKIELVKITVKDLVDGYIDDGEGGVVGFGGNLNIRPKYQREFVYNEKQRNAVIDTLIKGYPLNTMYWSDNEKGDFELIDGQQRTVSVCRFLNGDFSIKTELLNSGKSCVFSNLTEKEKENIYDYTFDIYKCRGDIAEKLDWFKTVNIAGLKLEDQEILNAVYAGPWTTDAKRHFSKSNGPAYSKGNKFITGVPIRQDYLETAIKWLVGNKKKSIENYMMLHKDDESASVLWKHFQDVLDWVGKIFPDYNKVMKKVDWGVLYNKYKDGSFNDSKIEEFQIKVKELMVDDDVEIKLGIYSYVFTNDERDLGIRVFGDGVKFRKYEAQNGHCNECNKNFLIEEMEADHIDPWISGGKTIEENCQMLCKPCNRRKGSK